MSFFGAYSPRAPVRTIELCGSGSTDMWDRVRAPRVCGMLFHWESLATYLAPELMFLNYADGGGVLGANDGWRARWWLPRVNMMLYSDFPQALKATLWLLSGNIPLTVRLDDKGGRQDLLLPDCQFAGTLAHGTLKLLQMAEEPGEFIQHMIGVLRHDESHILHEILDMQSKPGPYKTYVTEFLFGLARDPLESKTSAVSILGLLQWVHIALKRISRDPIALGPSPRKKCKLPRLNLTDPVSKVHNLVVHLLYHCVLKHQEMSLGSFLVSGSAFWAPLHVAVSKLVSARPILLQLPALPPRPHKGCKEDGMKTPLVELCCTAAWRSGGASPLERAEQIDGTLVYVVAVSTAIQNAGSVLRASRGMLEWLVFVERPRVGNLSKGAVRFCGPHVASLPEGQWRRWSCVYHTRRGTLLTRAAAANGFYKQAVLIRCDVPLGIDLRRRFRVTLTSESEDRTDISWRVPAKICPKKVASWARRPGKKLAICVQPVWDLPGLERNANGLMDTFLRYHSLQGFSSFTVYDHDGSFASHHAIKRLVKLGRVRYFGNWPSFFSPSVAAGWRVRQKSGVTGSRTSIYQELTLTHCIWAYRGEADLVLLSAVDTFFAVGSSAASGSCWPGQASLFQSCCGAQTQGGSPACWEDGRTFKACCRDFRPAFTPKRPLKQFLLSIPETVWRGVGSVMLGVCDIADEKPQLGQWSLGKLLWRTPTCSHMFYHLVAPWRTVTQNSEWVRLKPDSGRLMIGEDRARILHVVNLHGTRCDRHGNTYGNARIPCVMADHGLRWALPELHADQ